MSKCTVRIPEGHSVMASEKVQTLTDANFETTVNQTSQPILVDFWAEWCGPCRRLAPTVDELANDYNGKVLVAKMNVDENPATPMRFSIRDRKSTRLNSSHSQISYAVFCLKKKNHTQHHLA